MAHHSSHHHSSHSHSSHHHSSHHHSHHYRGCTSTYISNYTYNSYKVNDLDYYDYTDYYNQYKQEYGRSSDVGYTGKNYMNVNRINCGLHRFSITIAIVFSFIFILPLTLIMMSNSVNDSALRNNIGDFIADRDYASSISATSYASKIYTREFGNRRDCCVILFNEFDDTEAHYGEATYNLLDNYLDYYWEEYDKLTDSSKGMQVYSAFEKSIDKCNGQTVKTEGTFKEDCYEDRQGILSPDDEEYIMRAAKYFYDNAGVQLYFVFYNSEELEGDFSYTKTYSQRMNENENNVIDDSVSTDDLLSD